MEIVILHVFQVLRLRDDEDKFRTTARSGIFLLVHLLLVVQVFHAFNSDTAHTAIQKLHQKKYTSELHNQPANLNLNHAPDLLT